MSMGTTGRGRQAAGAMSRIAELAVSAWKTHR